MALHYGPLVRHRVQRATSLGVAAHPVLLLVLAPPESPLALFSNGSFDFVALVVNAEVNLVKAVCSMRETPKQRMLEPHMECCSRMLLPPSALHIK